MVLNCPKCEARLHLDEAKTPSRPFTVRCPKCQASVNVQTAGADSASPQAAAPSSSAAANPVGPFERPAIAQQFKPGNRDSQPVSSGDSGPALTDLAKLLAEALQGQSASSRIFAGADRRKVLVCASAAYRETIAESLASHDYKVFLAENMSQGLGRMREERMDIVILEANFDPLEQGVAFITREVRLMRPSERRKLFFVYITTGVRTLDVHAAFLQNVNLVVNPSDIEQLPEALEVSIRHYNELYKPFNRALDVAPI